MSGRYLSGSWVYPKTGVMAHWTWCRQLAWLGGKKPALLVEGEGLVLVHLAMMSMIHKYGGFPMLLVLDHRYRG